MRSIRRWRAKRSHSGAACSIPNSMASSASARLGTRHLGTRHLGDDCCTRAKSVGVIQRLGRQVIPWG